jgi:hypothetical protein
MSLRRKLLLVIPFALALALAGCKVNSINYFPPHPAQVRVLNLMPDVPAIDVQVNGTPAFSNVAFETATGYVTYDNASTTFSVSVSGSGQFLTSFSYPLAGEQPYTLILYGTSTNPSLTMLAEVGNPPTNGSFQVSGFNAAQNNSFIDIYVTAPGADISVLNPSFFNILIGSSTLILQLAPGTYQVQVTPSGSKTVIYDSGGTNLTPNIALTLVTYTRGSGTLVNVAVLQSKGSSGLMNSIFARIKAVNGASGVGPVNQLIATIQENLNVNYASASSYSLIPQGPTTVSFEPSAMPGATIASAAATFGPATDATAVVTGFPGSQQVFVLNDLNVLPSGGNDRLRFVNASWNSNPVNATINGTQSAANLAYGQASGYGQIAAATVNLAFTDAATGAVLASQDGVVLTPNQTSSIYLVGPAGAQAILVTQDN